jgi:hypothetical protein
MEIVCLFRTISIPDGPVSVWKNTISVLYRSKDFMNEKGYGVWYGTIALEG